MILLSSPTAVMQLITGGAQPIEVHASWVDASNATGAIVPNSANVLSSSATVTQVVASPAASVVRNVKFLSVRNTDPSVTCAVTVQQYDGSTEAIMIALSLQAGYTLFYEDASGWYVVDGAGGRQGLQGIPGTPGTNGTNGTDGTNGGNAGTATINFGGAPGQNTAGVVVTGQTAILSTSAVQAFLMTDATSDHTASDHQYAQSLISLTCGSIVPGTGFVINATCLDNMQGAFAVRWVWN